MSGKYSEIASMVCHFLIVNLMGVCASSSERISVHFTFDEKFFIKRKETMMIPAVLPIRYLFRGFRNFLKKPESEASMTITVQVKNKVYTTYSNDTVGYMLQNHGKKAYVSVKINDKDCLNIKSTVNCCESQESIIKLNSKSSYSEILQQINNEKICCKRKLSKIIVNDLVLDEGDVIDLKSSDKIFAIEDDSGLEAVPNPWNLKRNGLNLRSVCYNPTCLAYKQEILINKSYGKFVLAEEIAGEHGCPFCKEVLHLKKMFCFLNCEAVIKDSQSNFEIKNRFGNIPEEFSYPSGFKASQLEISKL